MNKRLWYINAILAVLFALILVSYLAGLPGYPSSARFSEQGRSQSNSGATEGDSESLTITASREFSYWLDPPPAYGKVKVTIEPAEAVEAGAQWRAGGKSWLASGDESDNIKPGKATISFKSVKGWLSPSATAEIEKDKVVEITAVYAVPPKGTVQVSFLPEDVLEHGPGWKLDGSDWLENGQESEKTAVGSYKLSFKEISGWDSPEVSVNIEEDKVSEISAEYKLIHYGYIDIEAGEGAQPEQGQWRINGGEWLSYGVEGQKVRLGEYKVSFKPVEDWKEPAELVLNISEEKTYSEVASYEPIPYGQISVSILPADDERISSAQWKLDSGEWLNPGEMAEKVTLGSHTISFKDIAGWQKPSSIEVNLESQDSFEFSGEYSRLKPPGPKFIIRSVIETGGGKGVAFTSPKVGYKVGEEIEGYKLIYVGLGKVILEKEGFEYELEVVETSPLKGSQNAKQPPVPNKIPDKNRGNQPKPGATMPEVINRVPGFNRHNR